MAFKCEVVPMYTTCSDNNNSSTAHTVYLCIPHDSFPEHWPINLYKVDGVFTARYELHFNILMTLKCLGRVTAMASHSGGLGSTLGQST